MARYGDRALRHHFRDYGRNEGRLASPAATRDGFVPLFANIRPLLEIGPFDAPMVRGERVAYFDILDRKALIERAVWLGRTGEVPEIDHVSEVGDMSNISEEFAAICSSHVIEHQPDLIDHLKQAAGILHSGGFYFLILPDKRYCFDHFLSESTVADIIEGHEERRKVHTMANVYRHIVETTHNDAVRHWNGDHKDAGYNDGIPARTEAARKAFKQGLYIDVHAWQFTPQGFRQSFGELSRRGLIPFKVTRVYDTPRPCFEFMAILEKSS